MAEATDQRNRVLDEGALMQEIVNSRGWKEVLKPWLETLVYHVWEDPRSVDDEKKYLYRCLARWAQADAANQLLQKVEGTIAHADAIAEQDKKKKEKKLA